MFHKICTLNKCTWAVDIHIQFISIPFSNQTFNQAITGTMLAVVYMVIVIAVHGYDPILQLDIRKAVRNFTGIPWDSAYNYTMERYGDISEWDTSQVTNMDYLFQLKTTFNENISLWNVSKVTSMKFLFREASTFNGDISSWDVSNVLDMEFLFSRAFVFNMNISDWNVA